MLETLRIQNYALIDELEVEFTSGFNVLTGETGAGKSILIEAFGLLLGARSSAESVRTGAKQAKVEALFRLPRLSPRLRRILKEADIELDDDGLIVSRTITAEGRSRAYLGGSIVPLNTLSAVGDELADMHGQHEHQSLLKPAIQLDLVDAYAGSESLVLQVRAKHDEVRSLTRELSRLESDDREQARRVEFLRFEVGEIDQAGLAVGEDTELATRHRLISNAERVVSLGRVAHESLYAADGDGTASSIDKMNIALRALEELADLDDGFRPLADQLQNARAQVEDVANEALHSVSNLEFDPQELESINVRLNTIRALKRKYGKTVEEILAYRDKALKEVGDFEQRDTRLASLRAELAVVQQAAMELAGELSAKRRQGAKRLDKKVTAVLQDLGMKGGKFSTRIEETVLGPTGIDQVEFLMTANVGEKAKPLRHVASGGEMSRIMLALKTVLANSDSIPILIFDEIDAGVGGQVARNVANKLRELADSHQVICISHLPQIAARASAHFSVSKNESKGRTLTSVGRLEGNDRILEVARLLDGSVTEASLNHARSLLGGEAD